MLASLFTVSPALRLAPPMMQLKEQQGTSTAGLSGVVVGTKPGVESMIATNRARIDALGAVAPDLPEIERLRFVLGFPDQAEAVSAAKEAVAWRSGAGKSIVESAAEAVAKATAGGGWDNEAVRDAAPHAAVINPYITPKNILTLSTKEGDLVYVIRAGLIDDKGMMSKVSVDQLVDFLLYVKEA